MKPGQIAIVSVFAAALVLSFVLFWLTIPKRNRDATAHRFSPFSNPGSSPFSDGPPVGAAARAPDAPAVADEAKAAAALAKAFPSEVAAKPAPVAAPAPSEAPAPVRPVASAAPPRASMSDAPLDAQAVRAAIQEVRPLIRDCYDSALKVQPDLAGNVTVEFELEAGTDGGTVVSGQVPDSETHSPFFEACVLEKVRGAHFPAPSGSGHVKVRYPFLFDPGGGFGPAPQ